MSSRIAIELPSDEHWIEMRVYLKQWGLTLPTKLSIKDGGQREILNLFESARKIVRTHERAKEFEEMLDSFIGGLAKARAFGATPPKSANGARKKGGKRR